MIITEDFTDWENFTSYLKELLIQSTVVVTFKKQDGTTRVLKCTLNEELLPTRTGSTKTRKQNENIISVYDLENSGWRSFAIKNVLKVDSLIDLR